MMRSRTLVGLGTLLGCAALAFLAPRPVQDNRPTTWFPAGDPRLASWQRFSETFGADDTVALVVDGGDPLGALRLVSDLSRDLGELPFVEHVTSAATAYPTECGLLLEPDLGGLDNLRFVGHAFEGPLNRTLHLWERAPSVATAIVSLRGVERPQLERLEAALTPFRARAHAEGRRLLAAGHPLVDLELDRAARDVDGRAMPLLVAVCAVVLLVATRSLRLSLALLLPVGLAVLATDGALGLLGWSSNLIVAIVKPLAFVLLLAAGFHVVVAFAERRAGGASGEEAARGAVDEKAWPTALCLLTTAIGFGSLALSAVRPVQLFGALSAATVMVALPLVLLSLPLLLRLTGAAVAPPGGHGLGELCLRLVRHGDRRSRTWLTITALVCAGAGVVLSGLTAQPHAIEYFPAGHPLRVDHDALAERGPALASVEALVSFPASLAATPAAVTSLDAFARAAGAIADVRGCVGLPLLLREGVHKVSRADGLPAEWTIPELLERHADELRPYVSKDGRAARLTVLMDELDAGEVERVEAALRDAFAASFAPAAPGGGARLELTGSYGLLLGTQRSLLDTLRTSLISAAVLMVAIMGLALRSPLLGLVAMPANALPIGAIFVVMGLTGIPLDVGTSMTAAIALGIAVDGTLHLMHAWRRGDLLKAARSTGRAMVLTTGVVGLGFVSLVVSEFGPTRHFGVLCATAMLAALVGDLVVLPATLRLLVRGSRVEPVSHPEQDAHAVTQGQ